MQTSQMSECPQEGARPRYEGPVIDACVFHEWGPTSTLAEYMEPGWREVMLREGDRGGPINVRAQWLYRHPLGKRPDSYPASGAPGSDLDLLRQQVLDATSSEQAVLGYDDGLLAMGVSHYHLARAVARAANRWTLERWVGVDPRLHGLVLVCSAVPEDAADDVREFGTHQGMVGVALGVNGLGRPFGHAAYLPIHQAAAELELPLVLQVGSDAVSSLDSSPTAGGLPSTYAEYAAHGVQPLMGHVSSMIMQGIFERFPRLKVLLVGGGAAWLPAYLWRLDYWYKTNSKEAPWLTKLPSQYFSEHVRIGTHSLEAPAERERLARALGTLANIDRLLVYTSCYPDYNSESAASIADRLPEDWAPRVFHENARELYRFSAPTNASS